MTCPSQEGSSVSHLSVAFARPAASGTRGERESGRQGFKPLHCPAQIERAGRSGGRDDWGLT